MNRTDCSIVSSYYYIFISKFISIHFAYTFLSSGDWVLASGTLQARLHDTWLTFSTKCSCSRKSFVGWDDEMLLLFLHQPWEPSNRFMCLLAGFFIVSVLNVRGWKRRRILNWRRTEFDYINDLICVVLGGEVNTFLEY